MVDDLGQDDLGMQGSQIQTPVMDSLASDGIYFDKHYTYPVCPPSRGAFLTGRYMIHTGFYQPIHQTDVNGMALEEQFMSEIFRDAGYKTAMIGKWDLGQGFWELTPTFRGFQKFYGFYMGQEDYYTHYNFGWYDFRFDAEENCGPECDVLDDQRGNYSAYVFTKASKDFIHDYAADMEASETETMDDNPLFLYINYQSVHFPSQVPAEYSDMYLDTFPDEPERQIYAGMLTVTDEGLGGIIEELEIQGMWENTLMLVISDNGGATITCGITAADNFPYRGGKCSAWEGGIHATTILGGPALDNERVAFPHPQRHTNLFHIVDWLPTFADISDLNPTGLPLDGVSQMRSMRHSIPDRIEAHLGYGAHESNYFGPALIWENYKIIQGISAGPDQFQLATTLGALPYPGIGGDPEAPYMLYDLFNDPGELSDISDFYPEMVEFLRNKLAEYEKTRVQDVTLWVDQGGCGEIQLGEDPDLGVVFYPWCYNTTFMNEINYNLQMAFDTIPHPSMAPNTPHPTEIPPLQ